MSAFGGALHGRVDPTDEPALRRGLRQANERSQQHHRDAAGGAVSLTDADSPHDLAEETLTVFADTTNAAITVNLPETTRPAKVLVVRTAGVNNVTLAAASGQTIDGGASAAGASRWVATAGNGAWHTV